MREKCFICRERNREIRERTAGRGREGEQDREKGKRRGPVGSLSARGWSEAALIAGGTQTERRERRGGEREEIERKRGERERKI